MPEMTKNSKTFSKDSWYWMEMEPNTYKIQFLFNDDVWAAEFTFQWMRNNIKCMNNELVRMWKEVVMVYFKELSSIWLKRTRKIVKASIMVVSLPAKFQTWDWICCVSSRSAKHCTVCAVQNTSQMWYHKATNSMEQSPWETRSLR
jgi:hypothetical protein